MKTKIENNSTISEKIDFLEKFCNRMGLNNVLTINRTPTENEISRIKSEFKKKAELISSFNEFTNKLPLARN